MISSLAWLGLAVADPERATRFYDGLLDASARQLDDGERRFRAGSTLLRLKPPDAEPPGGAHVHYAFSVPATEYETYRERMAEQNSVEEFDFGIYRSAYCFDPDGHCPEIAGRDEDGSGVTGIFEVVLEVESLEAAESWYGQLDMSVIDRGDDRRRVRLDTGPFELELWEPQRGIADARPGAHVDLGIVVSDLDKAIDRLRPGSQDVDVGPDRALIIDQDDHHLTLLAETASAID